MTSDPRTKEYLNQLKDLKLSKTTRDRMAAELTAYAKFHSVEEPVRVEAASRSIEQVSPHATRHTSLFTRLTNKSMTAALVAIMLVVSGGTSYAAQSSVPGDLLYPVKVEVNENIRSAFAVSHEAEARLQARLIDERLAEAEALAAEGNLSADAATMLSNRVKTHADRAESESAAAEAAGNYDASAAVRANVAGSLATYAGVLSSLNTSVSGNDGATLISNIRTYADAATAAQATATATIDASVDVATAAEGTIARADTFIADVTATLERAESDLSAEAYARAAAKLDTAVAAQTEAKASFRTEAYRAAYTTAQTAIRIASEVETMIKSALRIELNTTVDTNLLDVQISTRDEATAPTPDTESSQTESTTRVELESGTRTETDASATPARTDSSTETNVEADSSTRLEVGGGDATVDTTTSARGQLSL